jgi:F-type H+-transporting ATPase subunit delta
MSNSSNTAQVSRRYARALFELVQENTSLRDDLATVATVASADEVAEFLASPEYAAKLKQGVLLKAAGKISQEATRLVSMLCERNKSELLPEIHLLVEEMVRQSESEVDASVIVATKINKALQQKLATALEDSTGKKVRLNCEIDKSILGGLIINIGDRKIDYSLRSKLNGLRRTLAS